MNPYALTEAIATIAGGTFDAGARTALLALLPHVAKIELTLAEIFANADAEELRQAGEGRVH